MDYTPGNSAAAPTSAPSPKVSVLVPNRNRAHFLREALESVLQQDFTDFELLVSDDASTDDSPNVLREFARRDCRIRFVLQPAGLGLVGNWNWCLTHSRGDYIKFLHNDDTLARPDSLRRLVGLLESDSRVVLASSSAQIIDQHSKPRFVRDFLGRDLLENGVVTCRRCLLSGFNQIGEPSLTLFRRRCAGGGFNPRYRLWADVEFALRVVEQGRFAYTRAPLTAFRIHDDQETRRLMKEHLLQLEYYQLLVDFASRSWLGGKAARERLFEEHYRSRKRVDVPEPLRNALLEALDRMGRNGYRAYTLRRKLLRPFRNLHRSLAKRLWDRGRQFDTTPEALQRQV